MNEAYYLLFLGIIIIVGSFFKGFRNVAKKIGRIFIFFSGEIYTFEIFKKLKLVDSITRSLLLALGFIFSFIAIVLLLTQQGQ